VQAALYLLYQGKAGAACLGALGGGVAVAQVLLDEVQAQAALCGDDTAPGLLPAEGLKLDKGGGPAVHMVYRALGLAVVVVYKYAAQAV